MNVNNSSNRPRIRRGNDQFLDNVFQLASPPRLKTTCSEYLAIKKNLAKRLHSQSAATYDFDDGVICFRCDSDDNLSGWFTRSKPMKNLISIN